MKKQVKKLKLAKETVLTLTAPRLADVHGGFTNGYSECSDCESTVPTRCAAGCVSGVIRCFTSPTGG